MERTLISLNVPNFITIGVMAFGFFVVAGLIWQLGASALGGKSQTPASGGY